MKKIIMFATTIALSFLLTGCDSDVYVPYEIKIECEPAGPVRTSCVLTITWRFTSGQADNLALLATENIDIDFLSGNRLPIDINPNSSTIILKNNNTLIAASVTQSAISGSKVVSLNQSNLATWLSSYNGQPDEIILEIGDVSFDFLLGLNTIVAEVRHDEEVLAGSAYSNYITPPPGGEIVR